MLRSCRRPALAYDLTALASESTVTVGRAGDSTIRLDSPEVPFLLSRKHAELTIMPDGQIILRDNQSTNGTYVARRGGLLDKLAHGCAWVLQNGDTIGFGGPETIQARNVGNPYVGNPFLFKYYAEDPAEDVQCDMAMAQAQPQLPRRDSAFEPAANGPGQQAHHRVEQLDIDSPGLQQGMAEAGDSHGLNHDDPAGVSAAMLQEQCTGAAFSCSNAPPAPAGAVVGVAKGLHRTPRTPKKSGKENRGPTTGNGLLAGGHGGGSQMTPKSTKMTEILSAHLTCPICCEWLLACHTLSCGHMFCGLCLTTWLTQKQSCPSCRKPIAGIPVRCFQVDSTISDLLGVNLNLMSPATKNERKRKQEHWEDIQNHVAQDWATALQRRKEAAAAAAARHHRQLMGEQVQAGNAANAGQFASQQVNMSFP